MRRDEPDSRGSAEDQLLRGMRVQRVTMPDGRSLLYYSWPNEGATEDPEGQRLHASATDGDV